MYNRILKRPMFKRGGPSFSAQGTGITSPYDVPRGGYYGGGTIGGGTIHGNPMGNRTGFKNPDTFEQIDIETKALEAPQKGEWLSDVIGSFGAYGNPYKESGEAKTIGEMGYEQAEGIKAIRDEREARRKLASLEGLETRKDKLIRTEDQANKMAVIAQQHEYNKAIEQMRGENLEFKQKIKNESDRRDAKIKALDKTDPEYKNNVAAIEAEFDNISKKIIRGTPGMTALIQNAKDRLYKIHSDSVKIGMDSFLQVMVDQWNAKNPDKPKTIVDIIQEQAVADVAGTTIAASEILRQSEARGGRVGYQFGTPNTGAMPNQGSPNIMAQATTDTEVEDAYGVSVDEGIEGQQASVQMPYQEFRAAIPAEVSDEIVQLIYYNQDAFADFAQISTQADVYAFNNKYGVSLVLPMDTETT
jgi:hypothetical protein